MIREVETPEQIDAKELVNTIQQGYLVGRDPEHKQKKTFGPSTIHTAMENVQDIGILLLKVLFLKTIQMPMQ